MTETPEYDTQDQKKTSTSRRKKSSVTTREASKTAKESIPTKEKNNINARNVRFFQSLNSCLTDNTAKTLCCLPTTRRRGRRQTDGKRQRNAKINGRGMRKWIGTAGSPGTGSRKSYQTSENIHLFKYINIYNIVFQRYTGPEKEKKGKLKWNTDEEN